MDKVKKDGMIAVLISPGYGAGWSTWNSDHSETLCMDADIVQPFINGDKEKALSISKEKCPGIYCGGFDDCEIEWVPKGSCFEIDEYDGYESINIIGQHEYMIA